MSPVYGTVDVTDDGQVGEYERTFYQSYARLADNKLVRLIWDWDDARQRCAIITQRQPNFLSVRDNYGGLKRTRPTRQTLA